MMVADIEWPTGLQIAAHLEAGGQVLHLYKSARSLSGTPSVCIFDAEDQNLDAWVARGETLHENYYLLARVHPVASRDHD